MAELEGDAEEAKELFKIEIENLFATIIANTPVKTGNLKRGWKFAELEDGPMALEMLLSNGVFYLRFIELGGSKRRPKGFIRPAFSEFRKKLVKVLKLLAKDRV